MFARRLRRNYEKKKGKKKYYFNAGKKIKKISEQHINKIIIIIRKPLKKRDLTVKRAHELN